MIKVIDNFLREDGADFLHEETFKSSSWNIGWGSHDKFYNGKHWHRTYYESRQQMPAATEYDIEQIAATAPELINLWRKVSLAIEELTGCEHLMLRAYMNSHTYGTDAYMHCDDGNITAIYYPTKNWNISWEGGTSFYNEQQDDAIGYCSYRFNRLILFTASIPHRAMPVTRDCKELRTSIVFKTQLDANSSKYLQHYYEETQ
jgi:SM-20-related protein